MDARGGTITWFLTANDADFNAAMLRTRAEARRTGRAVDRDFGRGMKSARLSLEDFRRDLGRSAQLFRDFQIALRGFQMTSLILGVTLAGGAVVELVGALTAATQAVYALPGIIAPVIGAFGTWQTAIYGVGDAFKAVLKGDMKKLAKEMDKLSPKAQEFVTSFGKINEAFKPIRMAVQDAFFDGLGKQMEAVAKTTLPLLKTGMVDVAEEMNGLAKEAARVAKEPFFQGMIRDTLKTTATATDTLTDAVEPLAQAISGLVKIGLPYTNMLADWVVDLSKSASLYVNSAEGQKQLTEAINLGIDALQKIGSLIGSVFELFVALFQVSNQEGLSLIDTLIEIIDKTTAWVKSAEGQEKLTALFEEANNFLREGAELVGGFVNGILGLVEWFNKLPQPVKDVATNLLLISAVAGPVLGYISSLGASFNLLGFGAREIAQGFGLITGIDIGSKLKDISSSGGLVNKIFGLIARNPLVAVLGALAAVFIYLATQTTLFQDAWKALEPAFRSFGEAVQPLIPVVSDLISQLVESLAPIIPVIANAFAQILVALLPLVPVLLEIIQAILPVFVTMLQVVVGVIQFLAPILTTVAQIIASVLVVAINILVGVLGFLWDIIKAVAAAFVAAWNGIKAAWNVVVAFFTAIWNGIKAVFSTVVTWFGNIFRGAWEGIKAIWNAVKGFFQGIWNGITAIFRGVATWFGDRFRDAWNGIKNIWNTVGSFFKGIWDKITGAFKGAAGLGKNIVEGLWNGINNMGKWISDKIRGFGEGVLNGIKNFFGIKSPSRVMAQMGVYLMQGFGKGIDNTASIVVNAAQDAATGVLDAFSGMESQIGGMQSDFTVNGVASGSYGISLAPGAVDSTTIGNGSGPAAVIYQTNEVHTDLDMDQVNRNLTWELGKI